MKKINAILFAMILAIATLSIGGCNFVTRQFGGTSQEYLPANKKVVNISWENHDLWILTREMKPNEQPETLTLIESSNMGVLSGTVILHEQK